MARTVRYPTSAAKGVRGGGQPGDPVPVKLIKYIPGEALAFYVPLYGQLVKGSVRDHAGIAYTLLIMGLLGTVGYLFVQADKQSPPRPYFYVLAAVAFAAWALGTSTIGELWWTGDAAKTAGQFAIPAAVFAIPLIDQLLTKFTNP